MTTATSPDIAPRIAARLARTIGPRRYAMWFEQSARFTCDHDQQTLRVAVPSRFIADWIERNFRKQLADAAQQELGQPLEIDLQVTPDHFPDQRAPQAGAQQSDAPDSPTRNNPSSPKPQPPTLPRKTQAARHLRRSLSEFIVGPSNELAHAAACRLADADIEPTGPLFLHGGCGLGKTHLLQGIAKRLFDQQPDARVHYTTGEQFTNDYITAVRANKLDAFRKRIRQLDLLAVDDIHFIANKQATQQEFLHSFDQIELCGARVVLASDSHPKVIKQFSEALVSRCVRGLVVQIAQPDTATRERLIEALAKRRRLAIAPEVVQTLARRTRGSVREIEGTLTKLQAMAAINNPKTATPNVVGHALVHQLFNHDADLAPTRPVRFETVIETVCERLGVDRAEVLGRSRSQLAVLGRTLTIHLTRDLTSMSYPEIARAMGNRNHSTVITAAKRILGQLEANPNTPVPTETQADSLRDLVDDLRQTLRRA
ncbi:chromosomal replication initiator protein DnaA [Phycisphaerales bacterium AB-hyl4]|uniref:Chromosomal replication initiator protein DnaA n=1 Tax=Natronomicrosphaera hydrolytica TaxID=3242702 RepID=A0ABV4UC79_9BACT